MPKRMHLVLLGLYPAMIRFQDYALNFLNSDNMKKMNSFLYKNYLFLIVEIFWLLQVGFLNSQDQRVCNLVMEFEVEWNGCGECDIYMTRKASLKQKKEYIYIYIN